MAEDNEQERSLPASPRRLERAREEGRTARSRELAGCLVMVAGAVLVAAAGPQLAADLARLMRRSLQFGSQAAFSATAPFEHLAQAAGEAVLLLAPLFGILILAALAGSLAVGGWVFATEAIAPQFGRLSPARGFARLFSVDSLAELGKALAKAALVSLAAFWVFEAARGGIAQSSWAAPEGAAASVSATLAAGFLALTASLALIAAIDVPFVLWRHARELRMTRQEMRDEARESEGDPQLRMRVRSLQREMARKRMMAKVPKADVVVTNPEHYAVALAYHEGMRAPRVVAKGLDQVAFNIRRLASEHGVAVLESPALARALHRHCALGAAVPAGLYDAVAQVLAWVYALRRANATRAAAPAAPAAIEIPAALAVPAGSPALNPADPENDALDEERA